MNMISVIVWLVVSFFAGATVASDKRDAQCISFESPVRGALLTANACTLSIRACPDVESVHFFVRFGLQDGKSDSLIDLGTISEPPFKLIWNAFDVPNQLFKGMAFSAEAAMKNTTHLVTRQEGIFLYTRPFISQGPTFTASGGKETLLFVDTVFSGRDSIFIRVLGNWNQRELHLTVLVIDPFFSNAIPRDKMAGVEALLDPLMTKTPFPTEKNIMVVVPLADKPYRLMYKPEYSPDGKFDFTVTTAEYPYQTRVKKAEGKGYRCDISVPAEAFGGAMPDSIGCNILIKVLDKEGRLRVSSLNGVEDNRAYCPLLWTMVKRDRHVMSGNILYILAAGFLGGLFCVLAGKYFYSLAKRRAVDFNKFELSEEDKKTIEAIYDYIERSVTKKDLLLHDVAVGLDIPGPKIESFIKKYNGKSFKQFIMKSRVEIAKERLRSSHASQTAVADSCGFKNVEEMAKYFQKFCRTTPSLYRRENQVA
ncbi:MAG: helix-turn-helix domain-containing protein [Chitinivibrionales bacterium]